MKADTLDDAAEVEMMARESEINRIRSAKPEYQATGKCLHCDNELPEGHRWCDADCRDTFIKERRHHAYKTKA